MAAGSTYDVGDIIRVTGKFSTAATTSAYKDPDTVNFHYNNPGTTTITSYAVSPPTTNANIIRTDTGEFYVDITTTGDGRYEYRWTSTGDTAAGSEESGFLVRVQQVTT